MRQAIQGLYERYCAHHDMDRPLLQWIGVVGCVAFPLFYLLRRTSALPPLYDDLPLRLAASALCLGLALRRFWPRKLVPFYMAYSYATVFYSLSFLLSFTMLKNQGGTPSVVNMVMAAIIIILLADWRNTILMLVAGYMASAAVYVATDPAPRIPPEFLVLAAGTVLVIVAGALSHNGQKRAEIERSRLYAGLAGSIAHEVRAPLAQVQYMLEAAEARVSSDRALGEIVAQGQRAVRRGLQAIELTLRQLDERAADSHLFRELSAADCVRKAIGEFAFETPQQRESICLQAGADFVFRGDETTVLLILFNLLKNALYYLPVTPQARITLRVETDPVHRITVHDTGPGIEPELMARLFEEFQTMGKAEGTGLGLAFCRRAMRAFGGEISCRSQRGQYAEFSLTFPPVATDQTATTAATPLPVAGGRDSMPLAGRRVFVVDDSALNRAVARARLSALGAQVTEAPNAVEALRMLRDGADPDAVLMDMNMPGMGGLDATRALRALQSRLARIPVLLVTADPTATARRAAFAAGVSALLEKPLEPDLLRAELLRLLPLQATTAR